MSTENKFSILIVDDEPLVRTGLRSLLEQCISSFIIDIIREADDGKKAIDILNQYPVDLVFTDIVMPNVDGMTLLAWITANKPSIHTVVLSCHDDYSYVRGSFKHNILDYILKYDIDAENIKRLLEKAKEQKSRSRTFYQDKNDKYWFTPQIATMKVSAGGSSSCYRPLLLFIDRYRNSVSSIAGSLTGIVKGDKALEKKQFSFHPFLTKDSNFGFIIKTCECVSRDSLSRILNNLYSDIAQQSGSDLTIIAGSETKFAASIGSVTRKAEELLHGRFFLGSGIFFTDQFSEDLLKKETSADIYSIIAELKIKVYQDLQNRDIPVLRSRIFSFCNGLKQSIWISSDCIDHIKETFAELLDLISTFYRDLCTQIGTFRNGKTRDMIMASPYFTKVSSLFEEVLNHIETANITLLSQKNLSTGIRQAIIFIHSRYTSSSLSLSEVADHLGYSHSYLSRQFKKETGDNLVTYINALRLNEAKRLLHSNRYLVYEVAEIVGYNNYNYFSKLYKQKFGRSPNSDMNIIDPGHGR
jgi:two-component system, response regulator YesN